MLFVIRLSILFAGIAYAISLDPNIESATTSFLASAGVATIIVGFAAKDALSNLVSGIMIIIFRPFTISHWIKVGDVEGTVEQIKMLHTVIKDPHNRRLIIPFLYWAELQSPADRTPDDQELGAIIHANIRWGVFKRFIVGVEYMAGKQRIVDGTEGFAQRIQFAAKLNFTD